MKQLISQNNLTMSSLEIADLVQARHDSVKRTIERLVNQEVISQPPMVDGIKSANGVVPQLYQFSGEKGKRDSIIVVAQLCPEFTARLVDRWQELENQINQPKLPQNYLEALEYLVEAEKEKQLLQEQKEELEEKLEDAQPKINYADRHQLADGAMNIRDTAKLINIPERQFIQLLLEKEFVYRNTADARLIPYSDTIKRGLMDCRAITYQSRDGTEKLKSQAVITPKGLQYFQHHFSNIFA